MKILRLKILDAYDNIVRDIKFKENGVSYIYGDIKNPDNPNLTINSLGKTLLLKFIDLIFGAKLDNKFIKEEIKDYKLEAEIKKNDEIFNICRPLNNKSNIDINNKSYNLDEYKSLFNIDRKLYDKQFILTNKTNLIGKVNSSPSQKDMVNFLKLLNLDSLVDLVDDIYHLQDKIKHLNKSSKEYLDFFDKSKKDIKQEKFLIDKEIEEISKNIENISKKIKSIEIADIQQDIIEQYHKKTKLLKDLKSRLTRYKIEYERLDNFIENSNKIDISSEYILEIFERLNHELPTMVKRDIVEAEKFHQTVYEDRKLFLNNKKEGILAETKTLEIEIDKISEEIDKLGKIISENELYQNLVSIYENYNKKLQEIKFKQGNLYQIEDMINKTDEIAKILQNDFELLIEERKTYDDIITEYTNFIYNITREIYEESRAYFDISIAYTNKFKTERPIKLKFDLQGDSGEGVSEVKKNLIDFLLFRYNKYLDIMMQDSSCYNGIDPRQVTGMLDKVNEIAIETNKQVIISINKYQLGNYEDCINVIKENSVIILTEKDMLLGFEF